MEAKLTVPVIIVKDVLVRMASVIVPLRAMGIMILKALMHICKTINVSITVILMPAHIVIFIMRRGKNTNA